MQSASRQIIKGGLCFRVKLLILFLDGVKSCCLLPDSPVLFRIDIISSVKKRAVDGFEIIFSSIFLLRLLCSIIYYICSIIKKKIKVHFNCTSFSSSLFIVLRNQQQQQKQPCVTEKRSQ